MKASRHDLAEKEHREEAILSAFLPPLLSEEDIDRVLQTIIAEQKSHPRLLKNVASIYKSFYFKVDKSMVDTDVVKRKVEELVNSAP